MGFRADALLRGWALLLGSFLAAVPAIVAVWDIGPKLEAHWWPVIVNTEVVAETVTPQGVEVVISYDKVRRCDLVDLIWENGPVLLNVHPADTADPLLRRRVTGEDRESRPLVVRGIVTLEGTRAIILHRCHPLWLTRSQFYP